LAQSYRNSQGPFQHSRLFDCEDDEEENDTQLNFADVLEAMSAHYHEHFDALLRWSWKLFCHRWCRLIVHAAKEAERQEQQRREQEISRLKQAHTERFGGTR